MMEHFDDLETRSAEAREAALMAALPAAVARAKEKTAGFAEILAAVDPAAVTGRAALAGLPVTRKSDLMERQTASPPFGGLAALAPGETARLFASPGPIYEFEAPRPGFWRLERALFATGFRPGDIVHNCFSYHLTPGGWMLDGAARALGCAVIAGGIGNSEQQVEAIAHFRPTGYTGTPDFLKVLLDKGAELGRDCSSITRALVSGGALFPELRQAYAERGVAVLQCYATADLGLIAYESEAREGMILDEEIVVEILRPGTGDPLPEGEVGEVVVTSLNPDYPLIRFATGDLSAILPGASPCGRTAPRIKGWMGRADQATKVKGMFVQPAQVAAVLKRHGEIGRARLVVTRDGDADAMTLHCEVANGGDAALIAAIAESLQACCKLKGGVETVAPGSLPNDGKVIDDQRSYG
ncbi:phenylacetate--CoA ligase family protein [Pelagibius sp.]|uniref:phenylacetate--CoA ligase family protein n=1 Tax=Pelagibius sp. TaxID=1931238 RepID=UPI0026269CDF|nr:AMP-binding protein [Pelagibius sp.]